MDRLTGPNQRRQMLRGAEGEQAERGAGERQEEAGGEEVAEQQGCRPARAGR